MVSLLECVSARERLCVCEHPVQGQRRAAHPNLPDTLTAYWYVIVLPLLLSLRAKKVWDK